MAFGRLILVQLQCIAFITHSLWSTDTYLQTHVHRAKENGLENSCYLAKYGKKILYDILHLEMELNS